MIRQEREVTNVVSSAETIRMTLPSRGHIEIREKQNGDWVVSYSDPGFIPCEPTCQMNRVLPRHKHDYECPQVDTHYLPKSFEDAVDWAEYLSEGREVKIVKYVPIQDRRRKKAEPEPSSVDLTDDE